jgi:hypothetical protein
MSNPIIADGFVNAKAVIFVNDQGKDILTGIQIVDPKDVANLKAVILVDSAGNSIL